MENVLVSAEGASGDVLLLNNSVVSCKPIKKVARLDFDGWMLS